MSVPLKRIALAAGLLGVLFLVAWLGIRELGVSLRERAATHGLALTWSDWRVGWEGITLTGVGVSPAVEAGPVLSDAAVRVDWFAPHGIHLTGGQVLVRGDGSGLRQGVEAPTGPAAGRADTPTVPEGEIPPIFVRSLGVRWEGEVDGAATFVELRDVSVDWPAPRVEVAVGEASARSGGISAELRGAVVRLESETTGWRVASIDLESLAVVAVHGASRGDTAKHVAGPAASRIQALRASALDAADRAAARFQREGRVSVRRFEASVGLPDGTLRFGPGEASVTFEDESTFAEIRPLASSDEHGLRGSFRLPRGNMGARAPVELTLEGGPVNLGTLGLKEGDFGLLDVGSAETSVRVRLALAPGGDRGRLEGDLALTNVALSHPSLSDKAVRGLHLAFRGNVEGALDGSEVVVEQGEIDVGAARLKLSGEAFLGEGVRLRGGFALPLTSCQSLLDSAPTGLIDRVAGVKLAGSFGITAFARFDSAAVDRDFHLGWDIASSCRVTEVPESLAASRFEAPFSLHVPEPSGGGLVELQTGPGTGSWVPLGAMSRFLQAAVQTTEDGAFARHSGFDEVAIRSAIRDNIKRGQLYRGASTISMQLAKNLYLDRKKNLGRKLEEAVLTTYLEQTLTKDQILELYLNVVELGPLVYGVGPASRHYFQTSPGALAASQAFYLSSLLPAPSKSHFGANGALTPGWTRYLRKLLKIAHARGRLTDAELEAGLHEVVRFGSPRPAMESEPDEPLSTEPPSASDEETSPPEE